ncbi:MAG TPA: ribonuclease P protein component [Ktedonobacteraceae bacterium]|nr:ribonuclease P protein component [Ktedonobacteraceae bacterium]
MALSRVWRLRNNSDFQRVRQQGQNLSSRLLILAWNPNEVAQLRVGFVVSKRISKRAVQRNYIKRLLGEAVRGVLPALPANIDIVFTARGQVAATDLSALRQDMLALLRRAKLLSPGITLQEA